MREQEPSIAVKHFQGRISIGHDLAKECIQVHIAAQFIPKRTAFFFLLDRIKPVNGWLQELFHAGMVGRFLFVGGEIKHLGKGKDLDPMIDLGLVQFQFEFFQLLGVRTLMETGRIVVGAPYEVCQLGMCLDCHYSLFLPFL